MAAGTVVFSFVPGAPKQVPDNSCASVLAAATNHNNTYGSFLWKNTSCSSDPVVAGTRLFWYNTQQPSETGAWSIVSITATPAPSVPSTQLDLSPLTSVVIACFVVLLFFIGYGTGLHVNR